jgi:hypothetical protein
MRIWFRVMVIGLALALAGPGAAVAGELTQKQDPQQARSAGARWLVENQNADGGWGAGAWGRDVRGATSDIATTSLAVMALLRDAQGEPAHRRAIEQGVDFVVRAVESSPLEGARLQGLEGTQPQYKLGRNVDTHFAALMLGDVSKNRALGEQRRIGAAYDKVLTKVVAAQRVDGSFDADGWAPVLSSSVAAQSLYRARAQGKPIDREILERSDGYQQKLVDAKTGSFDASAGAGVDLYAAASSLINNNDAGKRANGQDGGRAEAAARATADAVRRNGDALIAGFGSVGGEEMLSYMMISDTMAERGGEDWDVWNRKIGSQLVATQNADGSWSGHHCITSTPFVTAAAVMTLGSGDAIAAQTAMRAATQQRAVAAHR